MHSCLLKPLLLCQRRRWQLDFRFGIPLCKIRKVEISLRVPSHTVLRQQCNLRSNGAVRFEGDTYSKEGAVIDDIEERAFEDAGEALVGGSHKRLVSSSITAVVATLALLSM